MFTSTSTSTPELASASSRCTGPTYGDQSPGETNFVTHIVTTPTRLPSDARQSTYAGVDTTVGNQFWLSSTEAHDFRFYLEKNNKTLTTKGVAYSGFSETAMTYVIGNANDDDNFLKKIDAAILKRRRRKRLNKSNSNL